VSLRVPDQLTDELARLVRRTQADARLPSVVAAVFSRGDVLWSDAVGLADAESGEEATAEHQYRIGSITKTFTAAAVMQLRDAGDLSLDDRLDRHLPDAADGSPTIRGLLSHLSGMQREVPGELWETMEFPDRAGLLDAYAKAEQVLAPGSHWHYSNLAFSLLGQVVEQRAGIRYERYVEERLLRPVGLGRTTWDEAAPAAQGYFVEPFEDVVRREAHPDLRAKRPAGQLWSTVGDLARWGSFLAEPDPAVLRPETAAEMRSFQGLADLERWTRGYGLGLQLFREGERIFFGHTGGMPGFISAVIYSVPERVGAAVLTNATYADRAMELVLGLATRAAEALAVPDPWRPAAAAPDELDGVLGSWWSEGTEWVFQYRDGRLCAQARDAAERQPAAVFEADGDDRFRVISGPERGELLRVVRDGSGRPVKLYWATYPFTKRAQVFGPERPS
jgi:CubicO group peptidase (beta-lactamase class C family)